jgi:O-antigen/teichoic acid export membrane protein
VTGTARKIIRTLEWRDWQALKTAGANVTVLALGYAIRLVVIPLSLNLLGPEQYGLWLAVGSLIAWGGLADLGLAPGLVNLVASACGREDRLSARRYISTALGAYGVLAGVLFLGFILVSRWESFPSLLGIQVPELAAQARQLVALCGALFALSSLTRVIPTACTALQEGYYAAWTYLTGSLASLIVLVPLTWTGASLITYALVMGLPPLLAQIGLGAYFFGKRHRDLRPRAGDWNLSSLRELWGVGGWLALHQAANLAVLYSATLIIANRLGPAAVTQYSVPYAVFAVLISTAYNIVSPYLPAYAEARARGDVAWIRQRARQTLALTVMVLGGGGALLVIAGQQGIRLWSAGHVTPTFGLLIGLACFSLLKACSNTTGVLLVGLGLVRFAACVYASVAVIYLTSAWVSVRWLGVLALPVAGAVAHACDVALSVPYALRQLQDTRAAAKLLPVRRIAM